MNAWRVVPILAVVGAVAAACASSGGAPSPGDRSGRDGAHVERVERLDRVKDHLFLGWTSGIQEKTRIAIRTPHELAAFLAAAGVDSARLRGLPVDFSRSMVVVASMGVEATFGNRIVIDEATVAGDTIRVMVTTVLIRNCSPGAAVTSPADIAVLRKSSLPVVFVEQTVYSPNCGGLPPPP